jgi:hypothetical protein
MILLMAVAHKENTTMKMTFIASVAALLVGTTLSFAGMPVVDDLLILKTDAGFVHLAKDGADDRGGDDRAGDGRDGDDRAGDDRGGRKPRIPGGSGCDDAGDIAEHAGCRL